jgi:hypothetical protein
MLEESLPNPKTLSTDFLRLEKSFPIQSPQKVNTFLIPDKLSCSSFFPTRLLPYSTIREETGEI